MLKNLNINSIDAAYQLENITIEKLGDNLHIEGDLITDKSVCVTTKGEANVHGNN